MHMHTNNRYPLYAGICHYPAFLFFRFESITLRLMVNWLEMSMYDHLKVCINFICLFICNRKQHFIILYITKYRTIHLCRRDRLFHVEISVSSSYLGESNLNVLRSPLRLCQLLWNTCVTGTGDSPGAPEFTFDVLWGFVFVSFLHSVVHHYQSILFQLRKQVPTVCSHDKGYSCVIFVFFLAE